MNLEFYVNEYLLAWYLLYSASLSKEIDKFRKNLWSKYKKEYNFCYKDKQEIIKYGHDFIPDNDVLYNEIFESDLYVSLKKETQKHKNHLVKLFNGDMKVLKKCVKDVLKLDLSDTYSIFVIHPRMECIEYNNQFNAELADFRDVKLPEYKEKIKDSYDKATQQFKDDFIFKLRSAIEEAEDQIENLNQALKESSFGTDLYHFTVKPRTEYRRYYDMLKDDIILETDENESKFLEKYKDVMEDLFRQISDTGNNDTKVNVIKNIEDFTDYRSYLDFDLIVTNKITNEEQRLSKMIKKKSGGETQTPFYISVVASFAQLYHVHDEGEIANTIRLIIFDEAFSKMDRERIIEAVKLLRKFKLQVILSAPPEKIGDISSLVDETLLVSRDRNSSHVLLYSKVK